MVEQTKMLIEAGELRFEVTGSEKFVQKQMAEQKGTIDAILAELTKRATDAGTRPGRKRGRPVGSKNKKKSTGRRPGRQPLIKRDSDLQLGVRQLSTLTKTLEEYATKGKLGKDATVFIIAYYLCTEILKNDQFSAGDVIAAHKQVGKLKNMPTADKVDTVQMLRNLAATSIGKVWIARNSDGTFALTEKGKKVGASGDIFRPRGRKAGSKKVAKKAVKKVAKRRGRPPKNAK